MKTILGLLWSGALACCACVPAVAGANGLTSSLQIVVSQASGGGANVATRMVASVVSKKLGRGSTRDTVK